MNPNHYLAVAIQYLLTPTGQNGLRMLLSVRP